MWQLQTDLTELVIRSASIFVFMFVLLRFWGKKHFGQLTPFDFILLLILSEAVQNALVQKDMSIVAAFVSILTMVSLNVILNRISFSSRRAESLLDGDPKILITDGKVNEKIMTEETLTKKELMEALRLEGVSHVSEVAQATLETNGAISVIKKDDETRVHRFFH